MLDAAKDVQGVATYFEFRKETGVGTPSAYAATTMMFLTPDGYTEDGRFVSASLYRRVVTSYSPRKQWRVSPLGYPDDSMRTTGTPAPLATYEVEGAANRRLTHADGLFRSLLDGGWTLVKEPLHVEVSKKDLTDVAIHKTPSKIVYRITQSRAAKGFPADYY
jgi:hypothetical protein